MKGLKPSKDLLTLHIANYSLPFQHAVLNFRKDIQLSNFHSYLNHGASMAFSSNSWQTQAQYKSVESFIIFKAFSRTKP